MPFWAKGEDKQEAVEDSSPAYDDVSQSDASSRMDGSGPGGGRFDLGRSGGKAAYDVDKEVILALEFASDSWNRWMKAIVLVFCKVAAVALYVVLAIMAFARGIRGVVEDDFLMTLNTATGGSCLAALVAVLGLYSVMAWRAWRSGRRWNRMRYRVAAMAHIELVLQCLNLVAYLVPNIQWIHADDCHLYSYFIRGTGFAQFSMWLIIFVMLVVAAHGLLPLRPGSHRVPGSPLYSWYMRRKGLRIPRHVHTVLEYTLWVHAEKVLLLWLPGQIILTMQFLYSLGTLGGRTNLPGCVPGAPCSDAGPPPGVSCSDWIINTLGGQCNSPKGGQVTAVLSSFTIAWLLFLLIVGMGYVARVMVELARHSYQEHRATNIIIRIYGRRRLALLAMFVACAITFWFVHFESCTSYLISFLGYAPMHLLMSLYAITSAIMLLPMTPNARMLALHVWLQDYAWAEVELPTALAARPALYKEEPMFCFETAVKALYFSRLVYYYDGTDKLAPVVPIKGSRAPALSIDRGLAMYDLDSHEAICEPSQDLTCMLMYSRRTRTIVLSFRGTASMTNVWLDLQMWRVSHPPGVGSVWRNTQPMVHAGFHACWKARGFGEAVVKRVCELTGITDDEAGANPELAASIEANSVLMRPSMQGNGAPFSGRAQSPRRSAPRDAEPLEEEDLVSAVDPAVPASLSFSGGRRSMALDGAGARQQGSSDGGERRTPIIRTPSEVVDADHGLDVGLDQGLDGGSKEASHRASSGADEERDTSTGPSEDADGNKHTSAATHKEEDEAQGPWRVLCVGHSLGGALACMAAMDIAMLAQRAALRRHAAHAADVLSVSSYTYGCPRLGNHASARLYSRVVPDGWDIVHHNDAVARNGKFLKLYKRAAKRVVVSPTGDMIVRPSLAELAVLRGHSSISAHLLASYGRSMMAVLRLSMTRPDNARALKGIATLAASPFAAQYLEEDQQSIEPELVQRILALREEAAEEAADKRNLAEARKGKHGEIRFGSSWAGRREAAEDDVTAAAEGAAAELGAGAGPGKFVDTSKPQEQGEQPDNAPLPWYRCTKLENAFVPFEGGNKEHGHIVAEIVQALWNILKATVGRSS